MRIRKRKGNDRAVALLIVVASLIILSVGMRELIFTSSLQARKVRNQYDQLQALYIAQSTLQLARFIVLFDSFVEKQLNQEADSLQDWWANPIPFPVPIEAISLFAAPEDQRATLDQLNFRQEDQIRRCDDFFGSFPGSATATVEDLSGRLNLNDLTDPDLQEIFYNLLGPDVDFIESLRSRGIDRRDVVREVRDYIDANDIEDDTNMSELTPYVSASLDYGPKDREMNVIEELKLVPSMDDELYQYLLPFVTVVSFPNRPRPGRMNLNTMSPELFEAILRDVPNPEAFAEEFRLRRLDEMPILFLDDQLEDQIRDLGLDPEQVPLRLLGGRSSFFEIRVQSQVNEARMELSTVLRKPSSQNVVRPYVVTRTNP